jgi:hypothetical protein
MSQPAVARLGPARGRLGAPPHVAMTVMCARLAAALGGAL